MIWKASQVRIRRIGGLIFLSLLEASFAFGATEPLPSGFFEKQIQPIFQKHCVSCHGPEKQKGGLRLDRRADAFKGGDDGPVILSGKPNESTLLKLVSSSDPEERMPAKGDPLSAQEIDALRNWIENGAPWPEAAGLGGNQNSTHWAYHPPRWPALPAVKKSNWIRNPIDQFVLARLEEHRLSPAPEADRRTLIRRLSFDLTGLPPTPAETRAFLEDRRPDAFERLIDQMLMKPQYGERWARHWLDLARFCESHGFEYDKMREHAWPYRDYVVRSFNQDKPYVRFVEEQIAGDVLEPITREGIIAASFLTAGPWDEVANNQVSQIMKARAREEELEEIVSAVGQTFLGVTIHCARCHAHKFDPIPQEDYYRIKSVFEGVRFGDRPMLTPEELKARNESLARHQTRIRELEQRLAQLESTVRQRISNSSRDHAARPPSAAEGAKPPLPFLQWDFERDANDLVRGLKSSLEGGARLVSGRLVLDGKKAFLKSGAIPQTLREKTLEAWVSLAALDQQGGSAITIQDTKDGCFDAIVFGEREPQKWMAGSEFFYRSKNLNAPKETAPASDLVHVAIAYRSDGSIQFFRNGTSYGERYTPSGGQTSLREFRAGESEILIGLRHKGAGNGFLRGEIEEARLYDRALTEDEIQRSFQTGIPMISKEEMLAAMTDPERQEHRDLVHALEAERQALARAEPMPLAYAGVRQQPGPTHRLLRGDVERKAELVTPGALSIVQQPSPEFQLPPDAPEAERRRAFARWVASAQNPLTARVLVNRVWQQHFGIGLVATPSDFGVSGEKPSHPELLDWLALKFVEQGWSIKQLHRLILSSATYRQSGQFNAEAAALDADNRWLWHFAPRRLEGEVVRDAMLAVSGQLNLEIGGASFRPFKTSTFGGSMFYTLFDADEPPFNRRTIYRMNINSGRDPLLESLDCPDPSVKTPLRRVTTTPLQALGLMNNSFVQRQAKHLAARLEREAASALNRQAALAFELVFGREANASELKEARALAAAHGLNELCWVLLNASEFVYVK
ncbi:MAG: DUF1553 domain-containing protein [Verrucomicrobiota bacterium]